jgi:ABC-type multidrug transport system ATPase subunit
MLPMAAHDGVDGDAPPPAPGAGGRVQITAAELVDPPSAPAVTRTRVLVPVEQVDAGRVRTGAERFTIGRGGECDLVLDHPTVARLHATIVSGPGGPRVETAGAGALAVNGVRTRAARLAVGDCIAVGPFRIVYDGHELVQPATAAGLGVGALGVAMEIGSTTILHPTDLRLRPGELAAIIGESGAGKSTLLKTLAGVTQPTHGRVLVGGEDVSQRLGELGYVPQFDIVHDQLTVTEALGYAARLRLPSDTSRAERDARVAAVVEQLGLSDRATTRVGVLSGGQRKRTGVGMELLHRPGALFLDEPTTGLDPGLERRMMHLFRGLADGGQTVALVTHATASLMLCDRVVVMGRGGHLRFDGTPDEALAHFGVTQFEDVYVALDAAEQAPRPAAPAHAQGRRPLPPLSAPRARRPVQQPLGYQTRVLASRYATLLLRDRRHVRSALLQVPVLGLLTALLFGSGVFNRVGDGPTSPGKVATLLFLMVTIAVWLGAINAAREIVKERNIVARELAAGVTVPAYLASKLIVLLSLLTAQVLLFTTIVLTLRPLHEGGGAGLQLAAVLVLASWIAVLCGLAVSASAATEDHATSLIPLLLVPQLLLGGALVPLTDMTGAMQAIAALVPARWSFAAAGHAIHLTQRIAEDRASAAASHYGPHFFGVSLPVYAGICALFAAGLLGLLVRRVSPRRAAL